MSPQVSVVIPLFGAERTIRATLESVLAQTFSDFEVVVVDDGSRDGSAAIVRSFADPRVRIVTQENRGLAGARNAGIFASRAPLIALLDADDLWHPEKLARHVAHFAAEPTLDVSFSSSRLIDDDGKPLGLIQSPQTKTFTPRDIFCRNPIGNGSAPVIRREAFLRITYHDDATNRPFIFDETFRQSEDIECWMRLAVLGSARFGHIDQALTDYRIAATGLSANIERQRATWQRFRDKVATYAPDLVREEGRRAEAYQLRYLARRAVKSGPRGMALQLVKQALRCHPAILIEEPVRTLVTVAAALATAILTPSATARIDQVISARMAKQS